jgi:hypothetical protein
VLVVVDSFPVQYLRTYTPDAEPTAMDRVAARGRVYGGLRTAKTWTQGFFGVLYSGSRNPSSAKPSAWRQLQDQGVAMRWVAFHNNGVPEASGVSDYRGLRASLLTDRFASLVHALGLDYNLFVYLGPTMRGEMAAREGAAYEALNAGARTRNPFLEVMVPEARRLQASHRRSVLVFHVINHLGEQEANWVESGEGESAAFTRRAAARDYAYDGTDEADVAAVDRFAHRTRGAIDRAGALLDEALGALRQEAGNQSTVIVTGDHGSIFGGGRIWYGYHPNDEVTRVPLFVLGPSWSGRDDRPIGTLNLLRGVADLVGASVRLDGDPVSALDDRPAGIVTTLTLRSEQRREWFLVCQDGDARFRANLHPLSDGAIDGIERAGTDGVARVREAVRAYGLDPAQVHERFR